MKLFKKLAGLCLALTFCAGLCAVASCGGSKDKGNDSTPVTSENGETSEDVGGSEATCYTVTVLNADGTPATGVKVKFCAVNEDGSLGLCYNPVTVDENGVCEYNPMGFPGVGIYEIGVTNSSNQTLNLVDHVITEAAFGAYTVTLAE